MDLKIPGKAVSCGVQPARALGSKLSAVTVTEPYEAVVETEATSLLRSADYNKQPEESTAKILAQVSSLAEANASSGVEGNSSLTT